MKNTFLKTIFILLTVFTIWACEKEETRAILNVGAAPALTASQSSLVLTSDQATDTVEVFTWTPADYGFAAAVKYTIQFAEAGTGFATPKNVTVPAGATSIKYTVAGLNTIAKTNAGLTAGAEGPVEVRIKAEPNPANPKVETVYSNTVTLNVTPY